MVPQMRAEMMRAPVTSARYSSLRGGGACPYSTGYLVSSKHDDHSLYIDEYLRHG